MIGSSRESLSVCQEGLDARRGTPGFDGLSGELFAAAGVLADEVQLRSVLADSGQPHAVREALVRQVFGGKVSDLAIDLLVLVTSQRWASDLDLVLALEQLADQAAFAVADAQGTLEVDPRARSPRADGRHRQGLGRGIDVEGCDIPRHGGLNNR